MTTTFVV